MKKVIRYPLSAVDIGNDKTQVCDGEGYCIVYEDTELTLNQWKFIVEALNKYAEEHHKYLPSK